MNELGILSDRNIFAGKNLKKTGFKSEISIRIPWWENLVQKTQVSASNRCAHTHEFWVRWRSPCQTKMGRKESLQSFSPSPDPAARAYRVFYCLKD